MRSSFVATTGLKLSRSPSARERASRRRWTIVATILALAGVSAGLGVITAPSRVTDPAARMGPFSYFPSE